MLNQADTCWNERAKGGRALLVTLILIKRGKLLDFIKNRATNFVAVRIDPSAVRTGRRRSARPTAARVLDCSKVVAAQAATHSAADLDCWWCEQ